jgi:hypothetical protein
MKYNLVSYWLPFASASEYGEEPEGCDLTAEQIRDAIMRRVRMAYESNELHEAIGAPYDTYEIEEENEDD